jgi:ribosome-binding factor A
MAEAIREVVASTILFEASDPRIRDVTVLRVEVTADLRQATVYVSAMGTEADQQLALRGLKHAAGFFQSKVAGRLQTRFTPVLLFKVDDSVKKSVAMGRLIEEALASDRKAGPAGPAPPAGVDADDAGDPGETPEGDGPHGGVAADPS